jgi:GT2 family glycosyltransferase
VTPATLTVSIVTYRPDLVLLDRTLRTLAVSLVAAREQELMRAANVVLIDNTGTRASAAAVIRVARDIFRDADVTMNYLHGHANIGYGAAHNLVMHGGNTHYHLVLNPDVELAPDALPIAFRFLGEHAEIGVLVPASRRVDGTREYVCKRYPTVFDLALRGFAPRALRQIFRKRLDHYEMRDLVDRVAADETISPIPAMSGSFMFVRRKAIEATGGFDPRFFLYFEDFDWSVRLNRVTRTVYVPAVKIVHHGGGAAKKAPRHIGYFMRSAARFFNKHGWKWL